MKKLLIGLLLIIAVTHTNAQEEEAEKLRNAITQHPEQDTFRVNRLNELASSGTLQGREIEKLADEAYAISLKKNYIVGEAYALANLSRSKFLLGNKQEAIVLILKADSIAKKTTDQDLPVAILLGKADIKTQTNENKEALTYQLQAEALAQKSGNKKLLSRTQRIISSTYMNSFSNYPKAMEYTLKATKAAEEANCLDCLAQAWAGTASLYNVIGDQENALVYYQKAVDANKKLGNKILASNLLNNIGERYRLLGKYPEAIKIYKESLEGQTQPYRVELTESNLADVYVKIDSLPMAFYYGFKSLKTAQAIGDNEGVSWIYGILSRAYLKKQMADSASYYATQGLDIAKKTGTVEFMRDNADALSNAYVFKNDFKNAYNYYKLYINYRDSMLSAEVTNKSTLLQYNYNLEKKQSQIQALNQQKKAQQNFLISALAVLLLIAVTVVVLLRNNRQKLHANKLLKEQKEQIEVQRDQTNKALAELQQTQKQLIQSEKMASLGELTAGISHEIQNPLNFVNNFSEINKELIDELQSELKTGNVEEAIAISNDIKNNEEKINHHGKRADSIVKGMLQHSRINTGQKELTDINALADEYIRLSYHGLRAKDKSFNADFKTNFDESIGKINIIPQDIGRVLLNLFNNAFYAVNEKKKLITNGYQPLAEVKTRRINDKVEISISDNGNGIPQNVIDKIFQPFFTTKPTGEGTGLGLSLTYDIIKAHGGEIKVETKEGEGSRFIIQIPV